MKDSLVLKDSLVTSLMKILNASGDAKGKILKLLPTKRYTRSKN
jgi:hypothetical protein